MSKILVLTPREIYPTHGGDKLRILKICEYLSKYHEVDVMSLTDNKSYSYKNYPYLEGVVNQKKSIYHGKKNKIKNLIKFPFYYYKSIQELYYKNEDFKRRLIDVRDSYDFFLVHLFRMEQYCKYLPTDRIHFELTDSVSMNYESIKFLNISGIMEAIYFLERKKIRAREINILNKYKSASLVSDVDKKYLSRYSNVDNVYVFGNGVDVEKFSVVDRSAKKNIIFIGNIGTRQNFDACVYFSKNIMPIINKKYNDINFKIIGVIPDWAKSRLETFDNVIITGQVEKIQSSVTDPIAGVCPMRYGAGIQNKILEYMAMGLPVISSPLGMEGLEKLSNHIFLAKTPKDYLEFVEKILDGEVFKPVEQRAFLKKTFSWDVALKGYEDLFSQ